MIRPSSDLRCAECRVTAPMVVFHSNNRKCPRCGSPYLIDPDADLQLIGNAQTEGQQGGVWVRISWQELRILSQWARFWADRKNQEDPKEWGWMLRIVDAITHQIKKAAPHWALTIADEAEMARQQNPDRDIRAVRPDGSEVQLEPTWLNREQTRFEPPAPKEG